MIDDLGIGDIYRFNNQIVKLVWASGEDLPSPILDEYGEVICDDDKVLKAYRYEPPYGEYEIGTVCTDGDIVDLQYGADEDGKLVIFKCERIGAVKDFELIARTDAEWLSTLTLP